MARYFFNVVEDGHAVDSVGAEYESAEEARVAAVRFAADLLRDEPERVWKGAELRIEATDAWSTLMFTIIVSGVDSQALARFE